MKKKDNTQSNATTRPNPSNQVSAGQNVTMQQQQSQLQARWHAQMVYQQHIRMQHYHNAQQQGHAQNPLLIQHNGAMISPPQFIMPQLALAQMQPTLPTKKTVSALNQAVELKQTAENYPKQTQPNDGKEGKEGNDEIDQKRKQETEMQQSIETKESPKIQNEAKSITTSPKETNHEMKNVKHEVGAQIEDEELNPNRKKVKVEV